MDKSKALAVRQPVRKLNLLSLERAAKLLSLSPRRIRELVGEGKLKAHRETDPQTRREALMLDQAEIEAYLSGFVARPVLTPPPGRTDRAALAAGAGAEAAPVTGKPWVTIAEASELSGLPESVIKALIEDGKLPALDCGVRAGGHWRIHRAELEELRGTRSGRK